MDCRSTLLNCAINGKPTKFYGTKAGGKAHGLLASINVHNVRIIPYGPPDYAVFHLHLPPSDALLLNYSCNNPTG